MIASATPRSQAVGRSSTVWSAVLRNVLLPAGDRVFGQRMMARLRFLEQAQWWTSAQLHTRRDALLQELVAVAYREVPFYRDLMDSRKLTPADFQRPADLTKLPVVTKQMLRDGYPNKTTRATGQKTYEAKTSGSTGENFAVVEDHQTKGWYSASFLLSLEWAGWEVGTPHMQTGMTLSRSLDRRLKDRLLRCHYVSAFDMDDSHIDTVLDRLEHHKLEHLWGYPPSLYFYALRALKRGWNRPLRSIVTWGDNLYPHYRKAIEQAFRVKVTDTYGVGEGTQVSAQCEHQRYHVHELDVIVEYVDNDGYPVPSSAPGNLLLTRLHPGPMPLIRYRVGDVGVAGEQAPCTCGRGFGLMQKIEGRDSDVVFTPSGNRLIVEFFNGIVDDIQEIDSFQVVQEQIDRITMAVVPRPGFSDDTKRKLLAEARRHGAQDLEIDIELVDRIPLTPGGKRRYVINKIREPNLAIHLNAR